MIIFFAQAFFFPSPSLLLLRESVAVDAVAGGVGGRVDVVELKVGLHARAGKKGEGKRRRRA